MNFPELEETLIQERQEYEDLTHRYDILEGEHVDVKTSLVKEKEGNKRWDVFIIINLQNLSLRLIDRTKGILYQPDSMSWLEIHPNRVIGYD